MKRNWVSIYADRRDKYGITLLSNKRAYRVIAKDTANATIVLAESGILAELKNRNIIQAFTYKKLKKLQFSVIAQKKIWPLIMPSEWSILMHVEASRLILETEKTLKDSPFTLDDPHSWNILFDGFKPYLVDMGAINFRGNDLHWTTSKFKLWPAYDSFKAMSINPLYLLAANKCSYARLKMQDYYPFSNQEIATLILTAPKILFLFILNYSLIMMIRTLQKVGSLLNLSFLDTYLKQFYFKTEYFFLKQLETIALCNTPLTYESVEKNIQDILDSFFVKYQSPSLIIFTDSLDNYNAVRLKATKWVTCLTESEDLLNAISVLKPINTSAALFNLRSPTPAVGPLNEWNASALDRMRSDSGIFFLDVNDLIIEKCMTVKEVLMTINKLTSTSILIHLYNLNLSSQSTSRNYGQLSSENIEYVMTDVFREFSQISKTNDSVTYVVEKNQ